MILHDIALFVFYYPLVMSTIWIVGAILFYVRRERHPSQTEDMSNLPQVSIIIPAFNEQDTIAETVAHLQMLTYPRYEIIVVDDGSRDHTRDILHQLLEQFDNLRVVYSAVNRGKAHALKLGLVAAIGEILVTVDSDAILAPNALQVLVSHFIVPGAGERVGAVTGNPRVRNRNSLLAKIQFIEYASVIGLIKRTQRIWGKITTVSGVIVAFRKRALIDCGLWDTDIITEDIAVTWKLEQRFWDVRYEPRALCWMLVPETLRGLIKQRTRWAQGGLEVLFRYWRAAFVWRQRRLWPVILEQFISIVWSIFWISTAIALLLKMVLTHRMFLPILSMGTFLATLSLIQIGVALSIDHKYEQGSLRYFWWSIWYPSIYWMVNATIQIYALIRMIVFGSSRPPYAVWNSPDRGIEKDVAL